MSQLKSETVSLYVVEEQEIYREIYRRSLAGRGDIEVLRISENAESGSMTQSVAELRPQVLLLSVKKLNAGVI